MFFSSIPEVICKSETYLSHAQNLCRKHSYHLITSENHSSWPSEHLLRVLLVHLADGLFERLIDYLIPPLMIVHTSAQTQMAHAVYIAQMLADVVAAKQTVAMPLLLFMLD